MAKRLEVPNVGAQLPASCRTPHSTPPATPTRHAGITVASHSRPIICPVCRRSCRHQPGDVVIHNNEEDDVFVECSAGPEPGQGQVSGQGLRPGHAPDPPAPGTGAAASGVVGSDPAAASGQTGGGGGTGGGRAAAVSPASAAELCGVTLENVTLLQLGGYEGALRVLRGRTTLVDVVVQFAMGGVQVGGGAGPGPRAGAGAAAAVRARMECAAAGWFNFGAVRGR